MRLGGGGGLVLDVVSEPHQSAVAGLLHVRSVGVTARLRLFRAGRVQPTYADSFRGTIIGAWHASRSPTTDRFTIHPTKRQPVQGRVPLVHAHIRAPDGRVTCPYSSRACGGRAWGDAPPGESLRRPRTATR
jgi:hypothetical protein